MSPHEILLRPIVTEKTTDLQGKSNLFTFEVAKQANKIEIRKAVEIVFGVRVSKVRTQVVRGSLRRVGKFTGRTVSWKKALVTLQSGETIDLFSQESA